MKTQGEYSWDQCFLNITPASFLTLRYVSNAVLFLGILLRKTEWVKENDKIEIICFFIFFVNKSQENLSKTIGKNTYFLKILLFEDRVVQLSRGQNKQTNKQSDKPILVEA